MLNVSMEKLRTLRAPLAPFCEQRRFTDIVWAALGARRRCLVAAGASEDLFGSLVQRAFRGSLGEKTIAAHGLVASEAK